MSTTTKLALLAVCAVAAHNVHAACAPRSDEALKAMSDAELKAAYCHARAESALQAVRRPAPPVLPGQPAAPIAPTAPLSNACLTETSQLVRTMEARKIDVDRALEACNR